MLKRIMSPSGSLLASVLLSFLATLLCAVPVARADNFPITFKGRLYARGHSGTLIPMKGARVTFWEDDIFDDDYLGQVYTDSEGRFSRSFYTDDQEGLTDPEYNVIVHFSTGFVAVGSRYAIPSRVPEEYEIAHSVSPEDHVLPSGNALYDFHDLTMEQNDSVRRWAHTLVVATEIVRRTPNYYTMYLFHDPYIVISGCAGPAMADLAWSSSGDPIVIADLVAECALPYGDDWNAAPAPPGATFESVTNEAFAWDEGLVAFYKSALAGLPEMTGTNMENGIVAPPSTADAPRRAASVAASLWDLSDAGPLESGPGPGFDDHDGTLEAITAVLNSGTIRSLGEFWSAWRATGNPGHFPVLALRLNGVDYNTPPVWTTPEPVWIYDDGSFSYGLGTYISDAESSLGELEFSVIPTSATGPVFGQMVGATLWGTLEDPLPPGHAFFDVTATDGLAERIAPVKVIYSTGDGKDEPELNRAEPVGEAVERLALTGQSPLRGAGDLSLALPAPGATKLTLHDVSGRVVRTLLDSEMPSGRHSVRWDGASDDGTRAPAGVYFARLLHGAARATTRLVLMR